MAATIQTTSKPLHPRVSDTSGNNNHGTAYTGQALEFDGVSDYINAGTGVDLGTGDFTISTWVYLNAIGADENLFYKKEDSNNRWYFNINSAGKLAFWSKATSIQIYETGDTTLEANTWYRVVVSADRDSSIKLYVNGVLDGTGSADSDDIDNDGDLAIGKNGTAGNTYVDGMMSDAQIWDAAWTQSDVTYDYLNPEKLVLDNSGTSLTYSDLKLWYPMQDGDRGNQSFLLDGANTGLGRELWVNGVTPGGSNWYSLDNAGDNTDLSITYAGGEHIIASNYTGGDDSALAYLSDRVATGTNGSLSEPQVTGTRYKLTFTAKYSGASPTTRIVMDGVVCFSSALTTEYAIYETYLPNNPSVASTDTYWQIQSVAEGDKVYFKDISFKPVNDKNHGTSVFYGDELAVNGTMEADSNWNDRLLEGGDVNERSSTRAYAGTYSRHINVDAANEGMQSDAFSSNVVAGRTYYIEAYVWVVSGEVYMLDAAGKCDFIDDLATTGSWQKMSATATAASDGAEYVRFTSKDAAAEFYVDAVTVKEVGFATGWTDADAQTTIPQLGFQSYNQLAWFDGFNDHIACGNDSSLQIAGDITYSCWFQTDSSASTLSLMEKFGSNTGMFIFLSSGKTRIWIGTGSATVNYENFGSDLRDGKWHHLVVTNDEDVGTFVYVDGVSQTTGSMNTTTSDMSANTARELYIGSYSTTSWEFAGCINEVSVWNSAFTLAQAQELYNDGEALDATTHSLSPSSGTDNLVGYWRNEGGTPWTDLSEEDNDGTPTNITEQLILPEGQNNRDTQGFLMSRNRVGLNLDGVAAYTDADFDFSEHSNWTISFWEYRNKATGASIGSDTHSFFISESGSYIKMYTSGGSTWSINNSITIGTPAYGQWVHRAIVKNGYSYLGYENGVLISTTADSGEEAVLASAKVRAGRRAGSSDPFNGKVDDIAIYSSALDITQVLRNYKAGKGRHRN